MPCETAPSGTQYKALQSTPVHESPNIESELLTTIPEGTIGPWGPIVTGEGGGAHCFFFYVM